MDKYLFFYEFTKDFKFEEDKRFDKGHYIAHRPKQLIWNDNYIYFSTKKAYVIIRKDSGDVVHTILHNKIGNSLKINNIA